ncbi:synaptic vesicle glycoprotein 2A isoform X1 [Nasonia vitripennis]|uniref:Major facilitator superfamily (MFS) profile domain-containing protein n=2 Tax=Nasonia vitripennis TaxID=7425 RepID=A0A7M7M740_NASVI|nr:synaptic vesicle glycoprotein 2A isoform X1 [Nasonia vitripennis]
MLTEIRSARGRNGVWTVEEYQNPADYEKAIATTGYGLFNILMLLAALPVGWTCVLDTTITAFFIQSTECDFELTLFRRGVAVGIVYIGMIIAGPLWDFIFQDCAISSFSGKRNVIIFGLVLDSICNILWAHATSYYSFVMYKFLNGILIAGPLSLLMPYLSEFHAPTYQQTFTNWASLLFVISNIFPPALASVFILRTHWLNFTIFNYFYETWRVYVLICTIPSIMGAIMVCLMPKSPKYLLTQGESKEALRVLKTMYSMNFFESASSFKIKTLVARQKMRNSLKNICRESLQDSISKLKMLFSQAYSRVFLILLALQFTSMLGFNTMRLWVPQLFITLNNFRVLVRSFNPDKTITMCEMLFPRIQADVDYSSCNYTLMPDVESAVYVNSTIIASSAVIFGFLFTVMTTTLMKKIIIIVMSFMISTIGSFGANWAVEIPYILALCSSIIVTSRIAGNIIIAYNAEVTPQNLRPTATKSINFMGNVGAAVGNIVFSTVLGLNCLTAFMGIGCLTLLCYVLSFYLLKKPIEEIKPDVEKYTANGEFS